MDSPETTSHNRTVLSLLPLAIVLPSGLNATLVMSCVCPSRFSLCSPETASHNRTVLSHAPTGDHTPAGTKRYASNVTPNVLRYSSLYAPGGARPIAESCLHWFKLAIVTPSEAEY